MRALAIGSVIALGLLLVGCDDDRPDDIPRTVPPVSSDGAATPSNVQGVGPTLEAHAVIAQTI
ncbi:MAG: hypothetical protein GC190_00450 [Alphaproteobacteria bacterium]|nr:hypothetical protein [Alphaproteobacteria bacterium]